MVNEKKTRVLKPAARQSVTGVVVNAHPASSRELRRRMRAIVHNAAKSGLAAQNRKGRPDFRAWVGGMISFIGMLNPQHDGAYVPDWTGLKSARSKFRVKAVSCRLK